jgi:hypothetical protein
MPQKTTKRQKSDSSVPLEVPRGTKASEPVQPEETQGIPDESRENSANVGYEASAEVEETCGIGAHYSFIRAAKAARG